MAITQATIEGNLAPGPVAFAAGIQVDASNAVVMKNSLLADNIGGNLFNPWNIRNLVGDGGGNLQWPAQRPNGQPEQLATATVIFADPLLHRQSALDASAGEGLGGLVFADGFESGDVSGWAASVSG